MEKKTFYKYAQQPHLLDHSTLGELKKITEDYPGFHAAWMVYLKNLLMLNDPDFDTVLKKAAPLLPDRKQLYRYIHANIQKGKPGFPTSREEIPSKEYVLDDKTIPRHSNNLIDRFLSTSPGSLRLNKPVTNEQQVTSDNNVIEKSVTETDDILTETLANLYAEQKNYEKALEAFKKLSLKYPEKNSYFATRIEEIIKLKNI